MTAISRCLLFAATQSARERGGRTRVPLCFAVHTWKHRFGVFAKRLSSTVVVHTTSFLSSPVCAALSLRALWLLLPTCYALDEAPLVSASEDDPDSSWLEKASEESREDWSEARIEADDDDEGEKDRGEKPNSLK